MTDFLEQVLASAISPLTTIFEGAHSRHYILYILSALVIAMVAHRVSGARGSALSTLLRKEVWTSRSAINDYVIWLINPLIHALILSVIVGAVAGATKTVGDAALAGLPGLMVWPDTPLAWAIAGALMVVLFLADDFVRFFGHWLLHKVPVLWEFHKVHHSAEHLNFVTSERFHPVELLFMTTLRVLVVGTINAATFALFADQVNVPLLFGANALWVAANIAGGTLRHSPVWISYGPRVERWIVSPAMHQVHHSAEERHWDRNMGGTLAVWDRMFGTLYVPQGRETLTLGIGAETSDYRTVKALYWQPLKKAAALMVPRRHAREEAPQAAARS